MHRISLLFIIILITSCSTNRIKPNPDQKQKFQVDVISYKIQDSDSFNVNIFLRIPIKTLVFKKQKDHFNASISYTLNMSERESKAVVNRLTKNKSISVSYYEDTRDQERFYQIETQIKLPEGEYDLLTIIQDIDSHRVFKNTTKVDVKNTSMISQLKAYHNRENQRYFINKLVKEDVDTIWFKFQMDDFEIMGESIPFTFKVLKDSTIIDSSTVSVAGNEKNMYSIPIKISPEWENDITIFIGNKGQFSSIKLSIEGKAGTKLWSENRKDIIGVMSYLVPYSEYKKFSKLEDGELFEFVTEYWKSKDPSQNTKKNELLEEINNRISYANAKFSVIGSGWRSDMGKIYIIYGPPETIDRHYDTEFSYSYEFWHYPSGRKFTFSDRRNFGELKLISEF